MKSFKYIPHILLSALLLWGCKEQPQPETVDPAAEIYQELKSVNKLVFASMAITKTARMEDSEWYKIGKRIAVYSYDSYMRAYIDLSELAPGDITVDSSTGTAHVVLPAIRTEVAGRDMELRREYENIGLLRSEVDSKERAAMKELANRSFRAEVAGNPRFRAELTATAERKARSYFETLLERDGYVAHIEFHNDSTLRK